MKDGCPVSLTQYRAALQIDAPRDEADTLKGVGIPIPSSGAVVSAVDASGGVLAPSPNAETPTTTPVLHRLNPEVGEPAVEAKALNPAPSTNQPLASPLSEMRSATERTRRTRSKRSDTHQEKR
jgi:hypothetical protein